MKFWLLIGIIYTSFFLWYTNLSGNLDDEEIKFFLDKLERNAKDRGSSLDQDRYDRIKVFMEEDDGKEFFMINNLDLKENHELLKEIEGEDSTEGILGKYTDHIMPELLKRASHPIFMGNSIHVSMDIVGIENAEIWDSAAVIRYKSRRALMEIATNPVFERKHKFKVAALEKTIAYPIKLDFYLGDLRMILAFILLIIGLFIRPIIRK